MNAPDCNAVANAVSELEAAQARLYVLRSALDQGEIDCPSAEVVAGDVADAIHRALKDLTGGS